MKNNITKLIFVITCVFGMFALLSCVVDIKLDTVEPDRDVFYIYGDSVEALGDGGEIDLARKAEDWDLSLNFYTREKNGDVNSAGKYLNVKPSDQTTELDWQGFTSVLDLSKCNTLHYSALSGDALDHNFILKDRDGASTESDKANNLTGAWEKYTLDLSTDFSSGSKSVYQSVFSIEFEVEFEVGAEMSIDEIYFSGCSS